MQKTTSLCIKCGVTFSPRHHDPLISSDVFALSCRDGYDHAFYEVYDDCVEIFETRTVPHHATKQ